MQIKRKKICIVATVPYALLVFMKLHIANLAEQQDVTLIANGTERDVELLLGEHVRFTQINIVRKISLWHDAIVLFQLYRIFSLKRFDVVHSITPKAGLLAMLAAFAARVPFRIHTFTGQVWVTDLGLKRVMLKIFDWLIANLATFNIVDSPSQQQFLINENVLSKHNSVVFGFGSVSGVDLDRFKSSKQLFKKVRDALLIPQDAFVFTYLGRLNKDKGVLDLANAFAEINDNNAYLLIVGPDEGGLVNKVKKINAHKLNQIKFVDFTRVPENYMAASNALCLPSYREGFGSVIIEAAAMGVPAIASKIYGISDAVVDKQTGLLHTAGDVYSLLFCLNTFLNDPEAVKTYGDAAKLRAIKDFDAKTITADWCQFYLKLLR